ncbi:hypothetical protein BJ138DRAFT_1126806 [Hygrophoropsis aurantiaca]|uniref:Uncharacterized protein n=1 Tax=Hygrophoropsis aurantiaca TaxID=72124 RepID=A0ACB8AB38_9AGAM|nr:hypothetical protein BJ138DRAFT_1126806 [Hygrophoropsis aurantiaca]
MQSAAFRQTLRPRRLPAHAFSRSASNSASENAQKKAQDALGSAQKTAERLWESTKKVLGPLGERAGTMLGSYRQPLTYDFEVARALLKQIYVAERLQPPTSVSAVTSAYGTMWGRASNPAYWREILRTGEWAKVGIYAVEAYGIFKIGEILGRRSLVGYNLRD